MYFPKGQYSLGCMNYIRKVVNLDKFLKSFKGGFQEARKYDHCDKGRKFDGFNGKRMKKKGNDKKK